MWNVVDMTLHCNFPYTAMRGNKISVFNSSLLQSTGFFYGELIYSERTEGEKYDNCVECLDKLSFKNKDVHRPLLELSKNLFGS